MLTQERVKELFIYDTGKLIHRIDKHTAKAGDVCNTITGKKGNQYRSVKIDCKRFSVHTVIYE